MRSKKWLQRNKQDVYVKKAKKEDYLTRAAFKLIEIEKKFKIITNSKLILELGSSPGGWSQVICNLNKKASIHAFDILEMKFKNPQVKFFKLNFSKFNFKSFNIKYDLILSDIAPNTIGHQSTDHLRIASIIQDIISLLEDIALPKSNFIFNVISLSNLIFNVISLSHFILNVISLNNLLLELLRLVYRSLSKTVSRPIQLVFMFC